MNRGSINIMKNIDLVIQQLNLSINEGADTFSDEELSELVAEHVGGWNRLPDADVEMGGSYKRWRAPHGSKYPTTPSYSTSIEAAWCLLEEIAATDCHHSPALSSVFLNAETKTKGWCVSMLREYSVISRTAPRAICLAALKAKLDPKKDQLKLRRKVGRADFKV